MSRVKLSELVAKKKKAVGGSNARGGDSSGGDFFSIPRVQFDSTKADDVKNLYVVTDDNGMPVVYEQPFHSINTNVKPNGKAVFELPKKDGTTFPVFQMGCSHYVHERDPDLQADLKESGVRCLACEIARMESLVIWNKVIELYPDFKDLTSKEKREAFLTVEARDDIHQTLESSFEFVKNSETGGTDFRPVTQKRILVAEVEDDGSYELKLWNVSNTRLREMNKEFAKAVELGAFDAYPDLIETLVEGEGEDTFYNIGGKDFKVTYPKNAKKAEAGRNATIAVASPRQSVVINKKDVVEAIQKEVEEILPKLDEFINNDYALRSRTYEEQWELCDQDYVISLRKQLGYEEDGTKPERKQDSEEVKEDKKPKKTRAKKDKVEEEVVNVDEPTAEDLDDIFG